MKLETFYTARMLQTQLIDLQKQRELIMKDKINRVDLRGEGKLISIMQQGIAENVADYSVLMIDKEIKRIEKEFEAL